MVAQSYTADEILAMDLPIGTLLLHSDGCIFFKEPGGFARKSYFNGDDPDRGVTYQILEPVNYVKTPDWVTEEHHVVWAPFWTRRVTGSESEINVYDRFGEWESGKRGFEEAHGIDLDPIIPPLPPVWEDPSGLTLEEARELAARLEEFDKQES